VYNFHRNLKYSMYNIIMNLDINKIKQVTLYLAKKIPDLYVTKYLKILYYLDFIAVLERGEPVTKDVYYHLPLGPVPSFVKDHIYLLKEDMPESQRQIIGREVAAQISIFKDLAHLDIDKTTAGSKIIADKEADESVLSDYEKTLLNDLCEEFRSFTATQLVDKTHSEIPYQQTEDNNIIDYKLAFYLDRKAILPKREYSFDKEVSMTCYYNL
jgi:hypothetical protein